MELDEKLQLEEKDMSALDFANFSYYNDRWALVLVYIWNCQTALTSELICGDNGISFISANDQACLILHEFIRIGITISHFSFTKQ